MPDSNFITAFDFGNTQFGVDCGEAFTAFSGKCTKGQYQAVNIDDVAAATVATPGGRKSDISVNVFIDRTVLQQSGIAEGDILIVRNKRVRVGPINDDGDNTLLLTCTSPGLTFK